MTGGVTPVQFSPPVRRVDGGFQETRRQAQTDPSRHISWKEVYVLRAESFTADPALLQQLTESLDWMESANNRTSQHYAAAQQLFRGILANPGRQAHVEITVPNATDPAWQLNASVLYTPPNDSILIRPEIIRGLPPQTLRSLQLDNNLGNFLRVMLPHESDHASRMAAERIFKPYTAYTPAEIEALAAARGCDETQAVLAENPFRASLGLPQRTSYNDIRNEAWTLDHNLSTTAPGDLAAQKQYFGNILSDRTATFNYLREQGVTYARTGSGCTNKTPEQLGMDALALAHTLRAEIKAVCDKHGITCAALDDPTLLPPLSGGQDQPQRR